MPNKSYRLRILQHFSSVYATWPAIEEISSSGNLEARKYRAGDARGQHRCLVIVYRSAVPYVRAKLK